MAERRLALLAGLTGIAAFAFMVLDLRGNLALALELRAMKLVALVTVAVAVAVSTVLFQTLTANRLLTPAIMGFDALFLLGQTVLVFLLGGLGAATLDPRVKFAGAVLLMGGAAFMLYGPMLRARLDLALMLLTGAVLGILFRSLTSLVARLIDPNAFAVLQGLGIANFNAIRGDLLVIGAIATAACALLAWRVRHRLDVLALGADTATGLGLDVPRLRALLLALITLLVAFATALVGPIAFLGLLLAALAERIAGTHRHAILLPAASLVGILVLVGGQTLLQHALGGEGSLTLVIEFAGGLLFLALVFAKVRP
jgi:iron complex transport system permease protein